MEATMGSTRMWLLVPRASCAQPQPIAYCWGMAVASTGWQAIALVRCRPEVLSGLGRADNLRGGR
eukprot:1194150-Amphidinium_carterae.1